MTARHSASKVGGIDGVATVDLVTVNQLGAKAPLASPTFTGTVAGITKAMVGLGSVDNTADTAKPVSTAQQTALDLKANLASPTFTGTVAGITKAMVGLGSVDNTSDSGKPVSTAQQTALDLKANLASPTLTGTPAAPTATASTNTTQIATTAYVVTERTTTRTLSGARFTKRVVQVSNTTSWTIDSDAVDYAENTGLTGNVTLNNPTGTPTVGQTLWVSLTGTASRTISYGTAFEDSTVIRPTTTSGTAPIDIGFRWNSATSKWRCVAVA